MILLLRFFLLRLLIFFFYVLCVRFFCRLRTILSRLCLFGLLVLFFHLLYVCACLLIFWIFRHTYHLRTHYPILFMRKLSKRKRWYFIPYLGLLNILIFFDLIRYLVYTI